MKEKIVVLDFGSQYSHIITKKFRLLGYYTEIISTSVEDFDFENVKGIILFENFPHNTENKTLINKIKNLDIPVEKIDYNSIEDNKEIFNTDEFYHNFVKSCNMKKNWNPKDILDFLIEQIKLEAENKNVLLFLSGGVNSTVTFALLHEALGKERVLGLHIDNGFMRTDESKIIAKRYIDFGFSNFILEDASKIFLSAIENIYDSQEKQKIIEETFLQVHNEVVKKQNLLECQWLLAQGSLYPDTLNFGETKTSHITKIHHNKVAGIQSLISKGLIIDPLKNLYKDEVRLIGKKIGLPEELIMRHPFSREGLSKNIICSNDVLTSQEEREIKKATQKINDLDFSTFIKPDKINLKILPIKSIGCYGNFGPRKYPVILYTKTNPIWDTLENISTHITTSISEINRTVLCLYENENCTLQDHFCDEVRLNQTRQIDKIVIEELKENKFYSKVYQHLTINLPYSTSKEKCSIVLRTIISEDGVTAKFAKIPTKILNKIVEKICKLDFVDAIYYDITNTPPANIYWE